MQLMLISKMVSTPGLLNYSSLLRTELPGYNHRSVQFRFCHKGVELDVDLLASPYWDTPREFYQFLRSLPRERRDMWVL